MVRDPVEVVVPTGLPIPQERPGSRAVADCDWSMDDAVNMVRDPVEVVVSGYLYHKNGPEDEWWLRRPDPQFGGVSYLDYLNHRTTEEGLLAEAAQAVDFVTSPPARQIEVFKFGG
eukprot:545059-Prorocentrum_minimum.AAC.1